MPIFAIHLALPPIYSHNHAYMRRKEREKNVLERAFAFLQSTLFLLKVFWKATSCCFLESNKKKSLFLLEHKNIRSHAEMNMINCLDWGVILVRFHCATWYKHSVNLCELHCPISQMLRFSLSLQNKSLTAVIRTGWTTLAPDDGWRECGLLKGYISH